MEGFILVMMFVIPAILLGILGLALVYGLFQDSAAIKREEASRAGTHHP